MPEYELIVSTSELEKISTEIMNLQSFKGPVVAVQKCLELKNDWKTQVMLSPNLGTVAKVMLQTGEAELFGYNLITGVLYEFSYPLKPVIVSGAGGTILVEVRSEEELHLTLNDPFVEKIVSLYSVLNACVENRLELRSQKKVSKVLVVGPKDSGKSTCCRTLINYGLRDGYYSTFVDLDPGQQGIGLPGVISASIINGPIHPSKGCIETAFDYTLLFGHVNIGDDVKLYKKQLESISIIVKAWLIDHEQLSKGGLIVNTAGWIEGEGLELLLLTAILFEATTVVVLESDILYWKFKSVSAEWLQKPEVLFFRKPTTIVMPEVAESRHYREMLLRRCFFPNDQRARVFKTDLKLLTFYQISSFRRIETTDGSERILCNELMRPSKLNQIQSEERAGYNSTTSEAWIATTLRQSPINLPLILIVTQIEVPGLDEQIFSNCVDENLLDEPTDENAVNTESVCAEFEDEDQC